MKELYSEIEIEATAEQVWQILTNFADFPQWNPFLRRASGEIEVGTKLEVEIQPPDGSAMTFKPTIELPPSRFPPARKPLRFRQGRNCRATAPIGVAIFSCCI